MQWGVGRGLPFLAPRVNYALTNCVYRYTETAHGISARLGRPVAMQPSDNGGSFSSDFGPFQGSKNWSS